MSDINPPIEGAADRCGAALCCIHPRLLIGMPVPSDTRDVAPSARPLQPAHMYVRVCWLSDSHALPVSRHYTAHPLPVNALTFAHPQSSRKVYFNTCALRHHLHLQTTRSREMMRSSPDASGGQTLTEAVPAPLISHMQFVDHVVLLHVGMSGYLHLWQTVASA